MSKIQEIESAIQRLKLTAAELRQIRDWLNNILEDELEFTDDFEAKIRQSERDIADGKFTRSRGGQAV